jgi:hypothetical protein
MKIADKFPLWWHYAVPLLFIFLFQAYFLSARYGFFAGGGLLDTDSYTRLIRVFELLNGAEWYDQPFSRANAPYGHTLHWTRPLDALLIMGAGLLTPFFGLERALHWAGVFLSPVLYLGLVAALVWSLAPVMERPTRAFAALLLAFQPVVAIYLFPGRADHHGLILLMFTLLLGCAMRFFDERRCSPMLCVLAGVVAGLGLWVSVEFLVALFLTLGVLALGWCFVGPRFGRHGIYLAFGLVAALTAALFAEQSPARLFEPVFDRISFVHWTVGAAALAFFVALRLYDRSLLAGFGAGLGVAARCVTVLLVGSAFTGLFWLAYPLFFQDPLLSYDPRLSFLGQISELKPVVDADGPSFGRILTYLGGAFVALLFCFRLVVKQARGESRPTWLMLTVTLGVYIILTVQQVRWGIYAGVLATPALAELANSVTERLGRRVSRLGRLCAYGLLLCLLGPLPLLAGHQVSAWENASRSKPVQTTCSLGSLSRLLSDPAGYGDRPRTILTNMYVGPELLYRTPHRVIATPYHRNSAGILAVSAIMNATDPEDAYRMLIARAVDLILLCPQTKERPALGGPNFGDRILNNQMPEWLREVPLPPDLDKPFRLFAVSRPK